MFRVIRISNIVVLMMNDTLSGFHVFVNEIHFLAAGGKLQPLFVPSDI